MNKILSHALSLLTAFLFLAAAAVWTGSLFGVPLIKEHGAARSPQTDTSGAALPDDAGREALGLSDRTLVWTERDSASWTVSAPDGTQRGVVLSSAPYASDVMGFAGKTPLYIYIGVDGRIRQIAAAENAETPQFFDRAFTTLQKAWLGRKAAEATSEKVDAVSGATFSSRAIIANMERTLAVYNDAGTRSLPEPAIGWLRTAAVAAVLALGVLTAYRWRKVRWLRIVLQVLNVGVLGFWCGQFLSLSLLRGWISGALDPVACLPTLLVLAVAVVLPFCKRPGHYCARVCPYGSAQELAALLPLPKIKLSARAYRIMSRVRFFVFIALMFVLWMGLGGFLLDYEPFTAFLVQTATPGVMILAGAFVVCSLFVPRLWCRALCPMGSLLSFSEK